MNSNIVTINKDFEQYFDDLLRENELQFSKEDTLNHIIYTIEYTHIKQIFQLGIEFSVRLGYGKNQSDDKSGDFANDTINNSSCS